MAPDWLVALGSPRVRLPALVGAGLMGALAFPAVDWWLLAWVWLVPVLACALHRPPRAALADGWLAGLVFFLVLLRWLDHTFRHYSAIPWPLGWLPITALAAYCGLYVGAVAAAVSWLRWRIGPGWAAAAAPGLWVGGEWLRGRLFEGFPWGLLGYSQHAVLPVIQVAELGGVYAVSLLVVSVNAALAAAAALGWRRAAPGLAAAGLLLGGALGFGWMRLAEVEAAPDRPGVGVAVIQPAIEQALKWDPVRHAEILGVYETLTRAAGRSQPALIVWPETAATIVLRSDPPLLGRLTTVARELDAPLLVGSIDRDQGRGGALLNSAFLLDGRGLADKYDKIQLVPFGEYVPLGRLIGFVRGWAEFISDFAAGERRTVFALGGAPFGVVICYEVIFPELFRDFVAGGAVFMVNITNDAWFGETSGPWQHLGTVPLRAVEHRVAIARAANTGVSAFVAPSGRVTGTLDLSRRGVLERSIPLRSTTTLYTRLGDWLPVLGLALSAAALGAARRHPARLPC